MKDQFVRCGYEKTLIENQIEKVAKFDRSVLLAEQNKNKKHHAFHYLSPITGHVQTSKTI